MNKIGFYLEVGNTPGLDSIFHQVRPPVILIHSNNLNKDLLMANRRPGAPNAFVIGRWYLTNREQEKLLDDGDPAANGRWLAEQILNHDPFFHPATKQGENGRLLIDAWMSLNEAIAGPASGSFEGEPQKFKERLKRYDALQVAFHERLQAAGIEAVAFNFAAGNFREAKHYTDYFDETLKTHKYLGFHEYGWPHLNPAKTHTLDDKGTKSGAGIYQTCMVGIREKYGDHHTIIITELGLTKEYRDSYNFDKDERDQHLGDLGWLNHTQTLDEAFYFDSLRWYNDQMKDDESVLGACLYEVGHSGHFESHRHIGYDNEGKPLTIMKKIQSLGQEMAPEVLTPAAVKPAQVEPSAVETPTKVTIRGTVTMDGDPVSGVEVRLIGDRATLGRLRRANCRKVWRSANTAVPLYVVYTATDNAGRFAFPDMPAGDYQLEVSAPQAQYYVNGFSVVGPLELPIALMHFLPTFSGQEMSTSRRIHCGINTDPANDSGNPAAQTVSELGAGWVRLVFKNHQDDQMGASFDAYDRVVNDMRSAGIKVLMILNNESCPGLPPLEHLDDAGKWHAYIDKYVERCRLVAQHYGDHVAAYQIWNEPDHLPDPPRYTPTVRAHFYGRMLQHAYQAIKAVSDRPVVTAGMVTGNPNWVKEVMAATGNLLFADALAVHPYGQRPFRDWPTPTWGFGVVTDLIRNYYAVAHKPIWITEFGNQDMETQATYADGSVGLARDGFPMQMLGAVNAELADIVSHFFWFCWSSGMVYPFGLHEANGERTPSYYSFQKFATLPTNGVV